jgi:hypothetical protein
MSSYRRTGQIPSRSELDGRYGRLIQSSREDGIDFHQQFLLAQIIGGQKE